jgi:hypothetical protein
MLLGNYNKCVNIYRLDQFLYGTVSTDVRLSFQKQLIFQQTRLVRLRSNLCLWTAPPEYSGKGRPRKHGNKFKLNEPDSWEPVTQSIELNDPKLGLVKVRLWENLHFRKTAARPMSLIRVERLDDKGNLRVAKPLWLAWVGEEMPSLSEVWRLYLRRFSVDHWYRFLKQRLHWTLPKLSTPKQCERWSDLMPMITWELWLARDIVADNPLPWQKSLDKLTRSLSCPSYEFDFGGYWHSCTFAQTSRKVSGLGRRKTATT